jgi:hypothetical protein
MSTTPANNFDGIHVSKGFVRGLQGQVLKLEQNQQSFIQQLEHANKLASEYHASAVTWQHKYDQALHKIDEIKTDYENKTAEWKSVSNQIADLYNREKQLRIERENEISHLEDLLAKQLAMSPSPSPDHPHRYFDHDNHDNHDNEHMSPVSIPSLSRLNPTDVIDCDNDDNDDDATTDKEDNFGSAYSRSDYEYYYSHNHDAYSQSSRTTDCSGDPICHSDTD